MVNIKRAFLRGAAVSGAVGLLLLGSAPSVFAQNNQGGSGLQISPTRHEITVEKGTKKTVKISIKNITSGPVVARPAINEFEADNVSGQPRINADKKDVPYSIRRFIKNIGDVDLAKDAVKDIDITVDVPADATPGAYYGLIRYQAIPAGQNAPGQVSLSASVGTIMLIEVPGQIKEGIAVQSVKAQSGGRSGKIFLGKIPDKVAIDIKNTGNSFIKPIGRVSISNSDKEVHSYEINNTSPRGNVLPASSRIFKDDLKNASSFGIYKITANIGFGKSGEVVSVTSKFWVVPYWAMAVGAGILVLLALVGFMVYRKLSTPSAKRRR